MITKSDFDRFFHFLDAEEAHRRIDAMTISETARNHMHAFVSRFAAKGFIARLADSTEFLEGFNEVTKQIYAVATPFSPTWLSFHGNEVNQLTGAWFYQNMGRSIHPTAEPPFDRLKVMGMVRPIIYAWENSENKALLEKPAEEKLGTYPYYRCKPGDRLLIFDSFPANPLEKVPVYSVTLRQVKVESSGTVNEGVLRQQQLKQVFGSVAEMFAAIGRIQYSPICYGDLEEWQTSEVKQLMHTKKGLPRTKPYIEL